jgi:SAM-dependent methyltransferase
MSPGPGNPLLAERLRTAADAMQKKIDEKFHPAISQCRPTRRRAGIARGMASEAQHMQRVQQALRALAQVHEDGTIPDLLRGFKSKSQIEELLSGNYPDPGIHRGWVRDLLNATEDLPETALQRSSLKGAVARVKDDNPWISLLPEEVVAVEGLRKAALKHRGVSISPPRLDAYMRLAALGIGNGEQYKQAQTVLEALCNGEPEIPKDVLIRQQEAKLISLKIPGFFVTPHTLAKRMVDLAMIRPGMKVLEPSAGSGNIADAVRESHPSIKLDVIEFAQTLRDILTAKGYVLQGYDFLKWPTDSEMQYDRIVMNPPFEHNQDIKHVQHAFKCLKPGGRMVSIMSPHWIFSEDRESVAFRDWFNTVDGYDEELPAGTFSNEVTSTGVSSRLVTINKES